MSERVPATVTRRMLLASAVLSAGGLATACASPALGVPQATSPAASPTPEPTIRPPLPRPTPTWTAPVLVKHPAPTSSFTGLPGEGNLLAWTVDDGTDPAVIAAYAAFAAATGTRLTLFATGSYPAWRENAEALRPLVASGQVQMANHTWTHPDLRGLSDVGIRDELQRTHDLIGELFGVDARPFYRPPFGYYNDRVMHVAAEIGYTATTMWYGSIADSSLIPEAEIVRLAHEWFLPQHIVIGHLNHAPVTHVFGDLAQVIADRGLTTVTLNDVFSSTVHP